MMFPCDARSSDEQLYVLIGCGSQWLTDAEKEKTLMRALHADTMETFTAESQIPVLRRVDATVIVLCRYVSD